MKTAALQKLTQPQAAYMLNLSARTLRDNATIPRNADDTYDAAELLRWARDRAPAGADVPAADMDRLLILADWLWPRSDLALPAIVAWLLECRRKHGPTFGSLLFDMLLDNWRRQVDAEAAADTPESRRIKAKEAKLQQARARAEEEAEREFKFVAVCWKCERIRRYGRWQEAAVPAGYAAASALCPKCNELAIDEHETEGGAP